MGCAESIRYDLSSLDKVKLLSWSELLTVLDDGKLKYSSIEIDRVVEVLKTKTIADVVGRSHRTRGFRARVKSILHTCFVPF